MSFNRLNYDSCTYAHNLRQSVGAGDYMVNTPRVECFSCFPIDTSVNLGKYGAALCSDKPLIDVDSELRILTRKASNCPTDQYLPKGEFCNLKPLPDCRSAISREDTRLSNPPCTLRSTGWNRWEWLCIDPQSKVFAPFDYNINNRLIVKDNHRPCIPQPINQSPALPPMNASDDMVVYNDAMCRIPNEDIPSITWNKCASVRPLI